MHPKKEQITIEYKVIEKAIMTNISYCQIHGGNLDNYVCGLYKALDIIKELAVTK